MYVGMVSLFRALNGRTEISRAHYNDLSYLRAEILSHGILAPQKNVINGGI